MIESQNTYQLPQEDVFLPVVNYSLPVTFSPRPEHRQLPDTDRPVIMLLYGPNGCSPQLGCYRNGQWHRRSKIHGWVTFSLQAGVHGWQEVSEIWLDAMGFPPHDQYQKHPD